MLQPAQADLHLRHDVPFGAPAVRFRGEDLEHRRPGPPETLALGKGVADRGADEGLVAARRLIGGNLVACMNLQEPICADDLSPHREWLVGPEAVSQTSGFVTSR